MVKMKSLIENQLYLDDLDCCIESIVELSKLHNKSILITGASGLIGSFLVDVFYRINILKKFNIKVYALGRNIAKLHDRFPYLVNDRNIIFIEHNVINMLNLKDINIDYCIHAASNAYLAVIYSDPVGTIMANLQGTYNLLDFFKNKVGKRFLFVSTGEIYGKCDRDIERFNENNNGTINILDIRSSYPLSKRTAENLCVSYFKQFGLESVIVRPCHTYGPNNTKSDNRANAQFVDNAINGYDIVLKSKGLQLRSYAYVADICSGLLTVLINGISGEAYNLSNNNSVVTISDFANIIANKANVKLIYQGNDNQPSPFDRAILDSNKLEKLGWRPKYNIEKGIEHTLAIARWLKC